MIERESLSAQIWLWALIIIFVCLFYPLLVAGGIADYISRRRLRKRQDAAIQEPAKRRPRRAF